MLNISPSAVDSLSIGNQSIAFRARFSGIARDINLPISSIIAIYAKETGSGMTFDLKEGDSDSPPHAENEKNGGPRPSLRIIK